MSYADNETRAAQLRATATACRRYAKARHCQRPEFWLGEAERYEQKASALLTTTDQEDADGK